MREFPTVSVVVPVFNSAPILPGLLERLEKALTSLGTAYEVILVDDDSSDDSWKAIRQIAAARQRVRGVHLMRNYGQHNALLCGIRLARHEVIITMDDDLQHPPEEIVRLLEKLEDGFDVVYGTPESEQHKFWRTAASRITKVVLQGAMGAETARQISAFRAFRTDLRNAFSDFHGVFVSIDVLLTWGASRFTAVQVRHDARAMGESNYTFRKLTRHALNMLTGFSSLPLQLASMTGFVFTVFGLLVLAYVLGRYFLQGTSVPGFPFLASVIAIFSGAQLFALGIIGEYLSRMHFRMMDRPAYAVRTTTYDDVST